MKKLTAAILAMVALLLVSSWARATSHGTPIREFVRGGEKYYEFMNSETSQYYEVLAREIDSPFRRPDNATPEERGRYWKSPLVTKTSDAYSVKKPAGNATVAMAVMPASLPKFSKGVAWGVVAVNKNSGKIVRGKITSASPDSKAGHQPAVIIFEEPVEAGSKLIASDRWYNNSFISDKRGELAIWNPRTASWQKLVGGMWLECDPAHMALVAETYGVCLNEVWHADATPVEAEQIAKKLGFTKVASPDGVRYTPVDIQTFKKLYAKSSLVRWHQRFLNNGGLAIGIPPEPVGAAINVGTAAIVATLDTRHNIPCLSTLGGGQSRFERDQKFYESGNALYSRDFEHIKRQSAASIIASGKEGNFIGGGQNFCSAGSAEIEDILAKIGPVSPTGYNQAYHYPGFWLEPKRVEWPSGGGMFRSPQLNTEYVFSNTYLHLFGGEIAPNATLHWGPAHKIDYWQYRTSSDYKGRGHFYGVGASAELVARHKWGGSDSRFAFWYGYEQLDKGRFHHERRHPWMFEWQSEFYPYRALIETKYGRFLDGLKVGVLAKTNDFLLAWAFPVLYRSPYDIAKLSAGPQFLHFFSRSGNEPKGGGLGVQAELLDGIGYRFSYFPFKQGMYHTGWVDPYRVYAKLKELQAEGIHEIPWDNYIPKITPAAISVTPPQPAVPKLKSLPPVPECAVKAKVKKYPAKKRAKAAKRKVKKPLPPCQPVPKEEVSPTSPAGKSQQVMLKTHPRMM